MKEEQQDFNPARVRLTGVPVALGTAGPPGPRESADAGLNARQSYRFEAIRARRRRFTDAETEMKKLKHNLGVDSDGFDSDLRDFVFAHHLNIEWYEHRISKERRLRIGFILASLGALLVIPIATYLIAGRQDGAAAEAVAAQITVVLTGIIAFHGALRSLLEKRNLVGIFSKASAALKKSVYDVERELAGGAGSDEEKAELFRLGLRDRTRRARDIADEEERQYFEAVTALPEIDLGSALTTAGTAAAGIVSRHGRVGQRVAATSQIDLAMTTARQRVEALRDKLATLQLKRSTTREVAIGAELDREIDATFTALTDAEADLLELAAKRLDGNA